MDTKCLRSRARKNLAGNWSVSIAVAAIASLLGGLPAGNSFLPEVSTELTAWFPFLTDISEQINQGWKIGNVTLSFQNGVLGMAAFLIGGVLQMGYASFLLNPYRNAAHAAFYRQLHAEKAYFFCREENFSAMPDF